MQQKIRKAIESIAYAKDADYEFPDNFRAYKIGDEQGEAEYDRILGNGCCGYYDEIHIIDGERWMLGFNYGH